MLKKLIMLVFAVAGIFTLAIPPASASDATVSNGYVLFSFTSAYTTNLIDTSGNVVKSWTSAYPAGGSSYLTSNHTLLRGGVSSNTSSTDFANGGGISGIIEELDDNSNVIWSFEQASDEGMLHHDFKQIDNNHVIALMWSPVEIDGSEYWNDNIIIIDKRTDAIVWRWSAYDDGHLTPDDTQTQDYIHFNSVAYKNGMILVSSFEKSTLYLIDQKSSQIMTTFTAGGELNNQHDATFLDNGNILVFNNRATDSTSAVYELDHNDSIVWEYSNDFFSALMGGTQRLPNGNTFICSAMEGRFLEVTPDGQEVWDYTPTNDDGSTGMIFRARKYMSY